MRFRTTLGEVLPVLGTIGLLGLWTFQQTGIEERAAELRKLASAHAVYQTYQSKNALFNAIVAAVGTNKTVTDKIRTFQLYNYELGLQGIENSLPTPEKTDIPAGGFAYDSTTSVEEKMSLTQERLEKLQDRLARREAAISLEASAAKSVYLSLYLALSFMMIVGAVLKAIDKLYPQSHQPGQDAQPGS
jgi:hypothetical protein